MTQKNLGWISLLLSLLAPALVHADAVHSPFPPTVPGFTIPNVHAVDRSGRVLRGQAPGSKIAELKRAHVTDVLIFKQENGDEVHKEIDALHALGYPADRIHHYPMRWAGLPSFQETCAMVVDSLQILVATRMTQDRKVYFHCSAGEDRTGMLAGLYDLLSAPNELFPIFEKEMCAHGYEAGDPGKPAEVVQAIRKELTPFFLKMAYLISTGKIQAKQLNPGACAQDPSVSDPQFAKVMDPLLPRFVCGGKRQ